MRRLAIFLALVAIGGVAHAGDKPLYQPVPAWVNPAPPIDATKLGDGAPVMLVLDQQQRLQDGQVWSYVETATRAASPQILGVIGTVQLPWQPAQGDLIVHRAEIIRGPERIDLLKGGDPFTVLRREQQMEQRQLDGMLTATLPVAGLATGDVLRLVYSVTRKDSTLKGDLQSFAGLAFDPTRIQYGRVRLIWPERSDVRWKSYADIAGAEPVTAGGYRELTVNLPLAKQPELPKDAPQRFQQLPVIEATTFADWAAVSRVMAPLYATEGLIPPGSPLAGEVARIAAATSDPPTRAALALRSVQDNIRYLLLGMDTGNYVPQPPARTWALRYGDCKAKTLLLLAMLHAMKIDAEPVLASLAFGDMVPQRLPGVAVFDHVLVRATIGGEELWLDGTASGARLADLRDTLPLGAVLPVRSAGAALLPVVMRGSARPEAAAVVDIDETAGVNLPAPYKAVIVLRGQAAEFTKLGAAQGSKDQIDEFAISLMKNYVDAPIVVTRSFASDDAVGTATVTIGGIAYPQWPSENRRRKSALDRAVGAIAFDPDRGRSAWRTIPAKTQAPSHIRTVMRITLPAGGAGFTIEGDTELTATLAGIRIDRQVSREGAKVTIDDTLVSTGAEIAAVDIPAERQRIAAAKSRLPRVVAPAGYPAEWQDIVAGNKARRFDAILALYKQRIANDPAKRDGYIDRAWFNERIYERKQAIADLDRALAIESNADTYLRRSGLYEALGDSAKAIDDAESARKLDPSSTAAINRLAALHSEQGDSGAALSLIQDRVDAGGKDVADFLAAKAQVLADAGNGAAAIATLDTAIADKPGDPELLNSRCWIKGLTNAALDTGLKDCTKAIELSDSTSAALDSRAMIYFRLGRLDDAMTDLQAALDDDSSIAASLYMRGVIRRRQGKASEGDADIAGARTIEPGIDRVYGRYGIIP